MGVERYQGHTWVICDACEDTETQPVEGPGEAAAEAANAAGWLLESDGWRCRECQVIEGIFGKREECR